MLDKNTEGKVKVYVGGDTFFIDIVKELFENHGIPYLVIEPGTAGYMRLITGHQNIYGAEIYVLKEDEEEALALIDAYVNAENIDDED